MKIKVDKPCFMWYTNYRMEKREKMIEIGTKIRFNYGAMHCEEFGRVSAVSDSGIVTINGYIGFVEEINESCIMMPGETTVNGSPIGVFVDE
jgi:hypothetical protein